MAFGVASRDAVEFSNAGLFVHGLGAGGRGRPMECGLPQRTRLDAGPEGAVGLRKATALLDALLCQRESFGFAVCFHIGKNQRLVAGDEVLGAHPRSCRQKERDGFLPLAAKLVQPARVALGEAAAGKTVSQKELPLPDGSEALGAVSLRESSIQALAAGECEINILQMP